MENLILAEAERNENEKVIACEREYKGKRYVDVRIYYLPPSNGGEYLPTKKGVTLTLDLAKAFFPLLSKKLGGVK